MEVISFLCLGGEIKNSCSFKTLNLNALPIEYLRTKKCLYEPKHISYSRLISQSVYAECKITLKSNGIAKIIIAVNEQSILHINLKNEGKIICHIFSPNIIALIQAMDRAIVESAV